MSIERKAKVVGIGLCALCLSTATGIGLSHWTLAGTDKFEELRTNRSPAYVRDRSSGNAFWEAQGRNMTPVPFDRQAMASRYPETVEHRDAGDDPAIFPAR